MEIWKEFKKNRIALFGLFGILIFILIAVYAPLISNSIPLIIYNKQGVSFPFFYFLFAPDSSEIILDRFFNYFIFFIPAVLILLILIATFMDLKFEQSVLIVIPVIGFLSWTGLSRIVRGEVLKQRSLPYIKSCEVFGMSKFRIMFKHILPNINGPIVVCAVFAIAANILAESGLSFLGFGVQPPTASWGEILKEAFVDPLRYWNLTLWPGLLLFMTILFFNLIGEGLRKAINNE